MFPPMTPLGERVRAELENQHIERQAAFRAQMMPGRLARLLDAARRLLANSLGRRTATEANPARREIGQQAS